MSEEEKKAIEFLKEIVLEFEKYNSEYVIDKDDKYGFLNSFKVVINLIEKQQKEIETWKETENDYEHELARKDEEIEKQQQEIEELKNNELDYTTIYINGVYEGKKYYKDKIREKIKKAKEINWHIPKLVIEYFEELLEEN